MKKIDITGWREVFSFTFLQTVKARSYLVTLAVFCLIAAAGIPIMGYRNRPEVVTGAAEAGVGDMTAVEHLKKVYLSYEKEEQVDQIADRIQKEYGCEVMYLDAAQVEEEKEQINDHADTCIFLIKKENGVYSVDTITGWDTREIYDEVEEISADLSESLRKLQMSSVIGEEYLEDAEKEVRAYTDGKAKEESGGTMDRYYFGLFFICIMLYLIAFAGQNIANSIIVEKSSKLVEYLLLSVRPMAIVAGKVAAILVSVFLQLGAMAAAGVLSAYVTETALEIPVMGMLSDWFQRAREQDLLGNLNVWTLLFVVLFLVLGLFFFALVASIAGASVSKVEETAEGMVMFTMLIMIGGYMAIALSMSSMFQESRTLSGGFAMFCCLFPVSSVFSVPVNLVLGSIPFWIGAVSLLILLAGTVLLLLTTARIYEYLLFYNGVPLKPKDIVHIVRYGKVKEGDR